MIRTPAVRACALVDRPIIDNQSATSADINAATAEHAPRDHRGINGTGAVVTALVLLIVPATKVHPGRQARRHRPEKRVTPPSRVFAIVLVSTIHKPTLRALTQDDEDTARQSGKPVSAAAPHSGRFAGLRELAGLAALAG